MKENPQWELYSHNDTITDRNNIYRLKVYGGYLYRVFISEHMTFVPDNQIKINHE